MSMKPLKSSIISGEASETDSEDESTHAQASPVPVQVKMSASVQGEIITGEDSESESDVDNIENFVVIDTKFNTNDETTVQVKETLPKLQEKCTEKVKTRHSDSLLHKKLKENNLAVNKNLNNFFTVKTAEATVALNGVEQQLMKSQLTLQGALNSLRTLNTNSAAIKSRLRDIVVDGHFLHNLVVLKNK